MTNPIDTSLTIEAEVTNLVKVGLARPTELREWSTFRPSETAAYMREHNDAVKYALQLEEEIADWFECARYDVLMSGPKFSRWNMAALDRLRKRMEARLWGT